MQDLLTASNITRRIEMVSPAALAEPSAESPAFGGRTASYPEIHFAYPGLRTTALRTDFVFALLALLGPALVWMNSGPCLPGSSHAPLFSLLVYETRSLGLSSNLFCSLALSTYFLISKFSCTPQKDEKKDRVRERGRRVSFFSEWKHFSSRKMSGVHAALATLFYQLFVNSTPK